MSDQHPNQDGGDNNAQIVVPAIAKDMNSFPISTTIPGSVPDSVRLTAVNDFRRNHLSQEVIPVEDGIVTVRHTIREGAYVVSTDTPGFDPGLIYLWSNLGAMTGSMPILGSSPPHGG